MKILFAIIACHERYRHCAYQRGAWISRLSIGASHRFFYGVGSHPFNYQDEIALAVPDGYDDLTRKVRAVFEWAYSEDYDYVFKCDDDTYVFPERVTELVGYDYAGESRVLDGLGRGICSGGGYWLSRKALECLVESPESEMYKPRHLSLTGPALWPEDRWVAEVLQKRGIQPINVSRISSKDKAVSDAVALWEYPGLEMVQKHREHFSFGTRISHSLD